MSYLLVAIGLMIVNWAGSLDAVETRKKKKVLETRLKRHLLKRKHK